MNTHKKLNKKTVRRFFSSLGRSPRTIAQTLKNRDIVGILGEGESCPLANAAFQYFGVEFRVNGPSCEANGHCYPTTKAASRFVDEFDDGKYPELVEEA